MNDTGCGTSLKSIVFPCKNEILLRVKSQSKMTPKIAEWRGKKF